MTILKRVYLLLTHVFPTIMSWETKQGNLPYRILLKKMHKAEETLAQASSRYTFDRRNEQQAH